MRIPIIALMLSLPVVPCALAQSDSAAVLDARESPVNVVLGDGADMLHVTGSVFTGPAHWATLDWVKAGSVIALTGVSALADDNALAAADRNRSAAHDRLADAFRQYGEGLNIALVSGGLYGAGLLFHDKWIRETGLLMGTATLLSGATSALIKVTVGRARPYTGQGNHWFRHFTLDDNYFSFPSGHTVVAFSVSTVLAERIGDPWVSSGLYGVAALTALSRVYSREHWFSDIVFGALLSTSIAHSVVNTYGTGENSCSTSDVEIAPSFRGLTLLWRIR